MQGVWKGDQCKKDKSDDFEWNGKTEGNAARAGDPVSGLGGRSPKSVLIFLKVGGAKVAFRPPSKIIEGRT